VHKFATAAALIALFVLTQPQAAFADNDQISVKVGVVNSKGAPEPKIHVNVPIGSKSDGAKIGVDVTGLENGKPVFFNLNPDKSAFTRKRRTPKDHFTQRLNFRTASSRAHTNSCYAPSSAKTKLQRATQQPRFMSTVTGS